MFADLRRRDVLRQLGALGITGTVGQLYSGSLFAGPGGAAGGLERTHNQESDNLAQFVNTTY